MSKDREPSQVYKKMPDEKHKEERTWTEEIEVAGHELVERVKELIQEGNVRRLIIRKPNGEVLFEVPLTASVVVGGVMIIYAPLFAALGAVAALLSAVKVEIVRIEKEEKPKDTIEIQKEE